MNPNIFCSLRSTPHLHRMVSSICRLFTSFHTYHIMLAFSIRHSGPVFFTEFDHLLSSCLYYACYVRRYSLACLLARMNQIDRFPFPFHFIPCLSSYLFLSRAGLVLGSRPLLLLLKKKSFSLLFTAPYNRTQKDWIGSDHLGVLLYTWVTFSIKFSFLHHLSRSIICEQRLGLRWIS